MSFKRDGDDENLLKNLNHLRVKELLSTHIPQDEAKLLSNGRLACMICLHRPVFDTINMLALHRRGKRHLVELSKYIQCKEEAVLKELHRKRPHSDEISMAEESEPSLLQTAVHQSPMLGSKHLVVKHSVFRHRRKPILEMQSTLIPQVPVLKSTNEVEGKSASATVRHYLKSISRKSSLEKVVEKNRENYGTDLQKCHHNPATVPVTQAADSDQMSTTPTPPVCKESEDHELKLRMSGWIKDLSGKWMKDPNVEFDSDEDETSPT